MALNQKLTEMAANAEADALAALFEIDPFGCLMDIRSGTQPVDADTAPSDGVVLATLSFQTDAFQPAVSGEAQANPISSGAAVASGTATWFRCRQIQSGLNILDGSIGTSDANITLNTTNIVVDAEVAVDSFSLICSKG